MSWRRRGCSVRILAEREVRAPLIEILLRSGLPDAHCAAVVYGEGSAAVEVPGARFGGDIAGPDLPLEVRGAAAVVSDPETDPEPPRGLRNALVDESDDRTGGRTVYPVDCDLVIAPCGPPVLL